MKKIIIFSLVGVALTIGFVGSVGASEGTLYVDDDDTNCGDNSPCYSTIQAAINAANDGDTIMVAAGTYTNDIWDGSSYRIEKSVTLLGAQAGVDPAGSTDRGGETILVRTNGLPYSLYADGITIDGFMIGSSDANTGGRLIISDVADNAIIRNNIIQNTPDLWAGHGVYIESSADNALVEYNTFYNTAWEAISSWKVSNAVISHNYISASGQHAIQMQGHAGTNNEISYNHISGITDKNAIQYWGGSGAIITNNVIEGGGTMYDGIWLDDAADDSTVSDNQISNTIYAGINVRGGCENAVITNNDIFGCGTGVETYVGTTGTLVNYNNIAGNSFGVRNYDTEILDVENNWWGHASGPSGDDGRTNKTGKVIGKGDAVSANVDWNPWLPQPVGHTPNHLMPPGLLKNAVEVSPGVFYLGESVNKGKVVDGYAFVHYAKGSKSAAKSKPVVDDTVDMYKLLFRGIKWADTMQYEVNTDGSKLDVDTVKTVLGNSLDTWDDAITGNFELFSAIGASDKTSAGYDNTNLVMWDNLGTGGIIAMNSFWFYRTTKEIVESDVVFNTQYNWSLSGESEKMDLQNIATHEFGHNGLADLYVSKSVELTMYGYSGYGETKKQTLGTGDISGIQALYGN